MANYSVVRICNMALTMLGAAHITAITEATEQASACNTFYTTCRDELVARYPWNFATGFSSLSRLSTDHATGAYQYQLPSDCLRAISIYGTQPEPDWYINEGKLVCFETTVLLKYIKEINNPGLFTDGFATALAALLAARISPSVLGSMKQFEQLMQAAEIEFRRAVNVDAREQYTHQPDEWNPDYDQQITGRG